MARITVLADRFEGKRLTAPNDVVVKSDGSIWFSDNGAGTRGNYLGHKAPWELPFRVYRLDPHTGMLTIAVDDMQRPNGLAHIPSDLVVTRRFSHHTLALAMGYPHHVSSAPTAICMEMRHGPDRQSDTQKPHDHR